MQETQVIDATIVAIAASYGIGAIAPIIGWRGRDAGSLRWIAGSMAALGIAYVLFAVRVFSLEHVNHGAWWVVAFLLLTIGPWMQLRFAAELASSARGTRTVARIGDVLLALSVIAQLAIPGRGAVGYVELNPAETVAHLSITMSSVWSVFAGAVLLWRSGRGMPTQVRRRCRMLALTVVLLYVAQAVSGVREFPAVLLIAALHLCSIGALVVSAMPPRWLRDRWQTPQLRGLLQELAEVSALTDELTIRSRLLPTIAQIASAQRACVRDTYTGELIDEWGVAPDPGIGRVRNLRVPASSIELELIGTPHDPFFGRDEQQLVRDLGVHLDVALARARIIERERAAAAATAEANEALLRANDELRRIAELRDDFVAMASHELRTPITTILGFSSTLMHMWDSISEDERRTFVELVERDARRLHELVEDLLVLSAIEQPNLRVAREPVLVGELLADLDSAAAPPELAEPVDAIDLTGVDQALQVLGDARLLRQVVVNLAANAMRHGAAPIRITTEPTDAGAVRIAVEDRGAGVHRADRERIFSQFVRAVPDGGPPGTGLGLFIVRRLMDVQGGSVWVEDARPHGARFVVELELAPTP